jgi:hypothetical protein
VLELSLKIGKAYEAYKCISSRYPSPSMISVTQAIFPSCQESLPVSSTQIPLLTSRSFLFFSKETSLSITLIPAKILHHVTFGTMAMIATRSFITYIQNNGNNSQKNIIMFI